MAIFIIRTKDKEERAFHFMDGKNRKAGDFIARYGTILEILCSDSCGQKNPGEKTKFRECFSDHKCVKLEKLLDGCNKSQAK